MKEQRQTVDANTKALIESLQSVSGHAEGIANALMLNTMTPQRQHDYANLLSELSDLLHEHAEAQEENTVTAQGEDAANE